MPLAKFSYQVLRGIVKLHIKIGELLCRRYQTIWPLLHIDFYDNYFNLLDFFQKPHSLERYVLANMYLKSGGSVLDIGCGDGFGCVVLSRKASQVLGVDRDKAALKIASSSAPSNVRYAICDLETPDQVSLTQPFDLITCFSVIQFLKKEAVDRLLNTVANHLSANGGVFIGSTTLSGADDPYFVSGRHKSYYESDEAVKLLMHVNFSSVETIICDWGQRTEIYFICRKQLSTSDHH